jgi:hypothetical protein
MRDGPRASRRQNVPDDSGSGAAERSRRRNELPLTTEKRPGPSGAFYVVVLGAEESLDPAGKRMGNRGHGVSAPLHPAKLHARRVGRRRIVAANDPAAVVRIPIRKRLRTPLGGIQAVEKHHDWGVVGKGRGHVHPEAAGEVVVVEGNLVPSRRERRRSRVGRRGGVTAQQHRGEDDQESSPAEPEKRRRTCLAVLL